MNDFQERLQELLEENNMSRLKLANTLGISSTTINGYFNKNYYPQIDIAVKMAKFFDCSLDYLFGLSDSKNNNHKNPNTFIENFKNVLDENNISVYSAMKLLGKSEYDFYRWKNGLFPKTLNLLDIAKTFDVSLDFLVGDKLI